MPPAKVEITDGLVIGLVQGQHPDLVDQVELAANGWDNVIYRLGQRSRCDYPDGHRC